MTIRLEWNCSKSIIADTWPSCRPRWQPFQTCSGRHHWTKQRGIMFEHFKSHRLLPTSELSLASFPEQVRFESKLTFGRCPLKKAFQIRKTSIQKLSLFFSSKKLMERWTSAETQLRKRTSFFQRKPRVISLAYRENSRGSKWTISLF